MQRQNAPRQRGKLEINRIAESWCQLTFYGVFGPLPFRIDDSWVEPLADRAALYGRGQI